MICMIHGKYICCISLCMTTCSYPPSLLLLRGPSLSRRLPCVPLEVSWVLEGQDVLVEGLQLFAVRDDQRKGSDQHQTPYGSRCGSEL